MGGGIRPWQDTMAQYQKTTKVTIRICKSHDVFDLKINPARGAFGPFAVYVLGGLLDLARDPRKMRVSRCFRRSHEIRMIGRLFFRGGCRLVVVISADLVCL